MQNKLRRFRVERVLATLAVLPTFGAISLVFGAGAILGEVALIRIGCAILAASLAHTTYRSLRSAWSVRGSDYRACLIARRDFQKSYGYQDALPAVVGTVVAVTGWLLAQPEHWFDATAACIFGLGLQLALWATYRRTSAQLQKQIDTI